MKTIPKTLALIATLHTALYPCGPFFEKSPMIDAEGASRSYADRMREPGIVLPSFKSDYLALLYLPLSGAKYDARSIALADASKADADEEALWARARKEFFPDIVAPKVTPYKAAGEYRYVTNCHADALRYARELLAARAKSPHGKLWLKNQDIVFANCAEKKGALTPPAKDAPQTVKNDFLYQEAAFHFYRDEYDKAYAGFEALAKSGSLHRDVARYMMIRTRMRQTGAFSEFPAGAGPKPAEIQKLIDTAIAEIGDPSVKANAKKLKKLFEAKRDEKLYAKNLIGEFATSNPIEIAHEFRYLVRKWQNAGAEKVARMAPGNDLVEWIYAFQAQDAASLTLAERKYNETKKSHWLIAALSKIPANSARRDFWLTEAAHIAEDNPAFTTVAFYRLALAYDAKLADALGKKLEKAKDTSSLNALKAVKLRHAQSLGDAVALMERKILPTNNQKPEHEFGFDADAARLLTEHATLADYVTLIQSAALSRAGKTEIARAGWARAILLDMPAERTKFAAYLIENHAALAKTLQKANSNDESLLTLLRNPGLAPYIAGHHGRVGSTDTIDSFRENWWCKLGGSEKENTGWDHYRIYSGFEESIFSQLYPASVEKPFVFAKGQNEFQRIKTAGNAAEFFSQRIYSAAEKDPKAAWLAEALHYLVKITRYGCDFPDKGKISKKAFNLLHKNFADSEWAKKTPHWFN